MIIKKSIIHVPIYLLNHFLDICIPFSKTACMNASLNLGLQLGDVDKEFIGNHQVKGCYAIEGNAFFGTEGSKPNHRKSLLAPLYRPNGYDCGNMKNTARLKYFAIN